MYAINIIEWAQDSPDNEYGKFQIKPNFKLTGLKLSKVTQSLAYKAIRQKKMKAKVYQDRLERRTTQINLGRARTFAEEICGKIPSEEALWRLIRHKDIGKKIQYFLWMTTHEAYKVGTYWDHIPDFERRGICNTCRTTESMEHILLECSCSGQKEVWEMAKKLWEKQKTKWVTPSLGTILACGTTNLKGTNGKPKPGESRLYRILISESAYLIWKLRNERVINEKDPPSKKEIKTDGTKHWKQDTRLTTY